MDDVTGRKILAALYKRDPFRPKFRLNPMWGLRFLHLSSLVRLYRSNVEIPPCPLSVRFLELPGVKKPGRKLPPFSGRTKDCQKSTTSRAAPLLCCRNFRQSADSAGLSTRTISPWVGGFCDRTLFRQPLDRVEVGDRTCRDCRSVILPPRAGPAFTQSSRSLPIRSGSTRHCQHTHISWGSMARSSLQRDRLGLLAQRGGAPRLLRLFVVARTPYGSGKGKSKYDREPAFLLITGAGRSK